MSSCKLHIKQASTTSSRLHGVEFIDIVAVKMSVGINVSMVQGSLAVEAPQSVLLDRHAWRARQSTSTLVSLLQTN